MPADIVPTQAAPVEPSGGVIHDIGYQRYEGPRLGRGYAARSLYVHSLRAAFGLGRSAKSKIFPWLVVALVFMIATVAVAVRGQSGTALLGYLQFTDTVSMPTLLFLAVVAPELVSRDLRAHVLPLYFSRPLSRSDYALTKLGAMTTAAWLLLASPQLLMFIGGVFSRKDGMSGLLDELHDFGQGVSYAAIAAVAFSALAVLLASLSSRRAVAAAVIAGVYLVTAPVAVVLATLGGAIGKVSPVINPVTLIEGLERWLYGRNTGVDIGDYGVVYLAVAVVLLVAYVALLLARYRKVAA
ncbi:ABC transporter permease [Rugosimonospora africana]|uniref:Membrane protein n=1 Tax=Rugosimonospora africana TaxID=556532 RepID=A0A8J3QZS2_9ACTN|nr:ABC transporter permease [Rugosimonospora africana]GIH20299.1 membrane protein [Rugosimonospora africana]